METQLLNKFDLLYFNDMNTEMKADAAASFAKKAHLSLEQAETELERMNPSVILSTNNIDNSGNQDASIINLFE